MGRRGMRIGLTGGSASGKSTVAQRFQELGVPVIDADESARRVVAPGTAGLTAVVRRFGSHLLTDSGELDRRALRNLIFSDPARRRELESILHPLIRADMKSRADASPGPYLVMAIPLLVEGGAWTLAVTALSWLIALAGGSAGTASPSSSMTLPASGS